MRRQANSPLAWWVFAATSILFPQIADAGWALTYQDVSDEPVGALRDTGENPQPETYWNYIGHGFAESNPASSLIPPIGVASNGILYEATEENFASPAIPETTIEKAGKWMWVWTGSIEGYTSYRFDYDLKVRAQASALLWIKSPEKLGFGTLEARAGGTVTAVNARENPHSKSHGIGVGVRVVEDEGGVIGDGGGPSPVTLNWGHPNKKEHRPSHAITFVPIMISGTVDAPGSACFIYVSAWASVLAGESRYRGEASNATANAALENVDGMPAFQGPVRIGY